MNSHMKTLSMVPLLLVLLCLSWPACSKDQPMETFRATDSESTTIDPTKVINLSWHPRAFLYKNFLTNEECNHLIGLAKNHLTRSTVGNFAKSEFRTSSGTFLLKGQDNIVKTVEDKIAAWTFLPTENGERMQVLKYEQGQKYGPHLDYFLRKNPAPGGSRVATVLMYLSDVIKGGETVFPSAEDRSTFKDISWTECGRRGGAVQPMKGDALLFYSLHPNNTLDKASLHLGCPVIEGEKWSATKWLHESSHEREGYPEKPSSSEVGN